MERDQNTEAELISDPMSETIVKTAERIATTEGTDAVTVRRILVELGITNRVFYNRFHNADEVLECVYQGMIHRIRPYIVSEYREGEDFFAYVMDVVERSLTVSYETKMRLSQFLFQNDSLSRASYEWWTEEIRRLIEFAMEKDLIKRVDSQKLAYSIWCFCRGYNADAVGRGLDREEAIAGFRYAFGFLLDGLKK